MILSDIPAYNETK